jgi:hypothetical protein
MKDMQLLCSFYVVAFGSICSKDMNGAPKNDMKDMQLLCSFYVVAFGSICSKDMNVARKTT